MNRWVISSSTGHKVDIMFLAPALTFINIKLHIIFIAVINLWFGFMFEIIFNIFECRTV